MLAGATRLLVLISLLGGALPLPAQYVQVELPLKELPQEHEYQRTIRKYLAGLTEKDLTVEQKKCTVSPPSADREEQYRLWLLTQHLPAVEAAALPATAFTLKAIEGRKGLTMPAAPASSQMLAWLAGWDYPGNAHRGSPGLLRRAFVLAVIDLVMLDYLYEHDPRGADRSDFLGGNLIWIGYTYRQANEVLPAEVRAATEAGLKKHVLRLNRWGPRGAMTDMDLFAPVGLSHVAGAMQDAEVKKIAEAYSRRLFTEERFFHPAGYFVDVGCFDTSYNGISLYFAAWAALVSEWKFAQDAVEKAYRLRAHLSLPDPDGKSFGPSHMSSRTSADSSHDQWNFPHRPHSTALVTDEALHLAPLPSPEAMKNAGERVVSHVNRLLETPRKPAEQPWRESHWSGSIHFGHEHYRKGYLARREKLEKEGSPLLQPLYARKERFIHQFDDCFTIARFDGYAAVIHTGPIRGWPHGFGGGQLSAFWTPEAGPVLLGRRKGMQGPIKDQREDWRTWPVHAVSGLLADGQLITSADIPRPRVQSTTRELTGEVIVSGAIPLPGGKAGPEYRRQFSLKPEGLSIQTSLAQEGLPKVTGLHETIPIFLNDGARVASTGMRIEWQVGDRWTEAEPRPTDNVRAVRVQRYRGKIQITFDRPRRVQLSPKEWSDSYQSRATCRTILIDLLQGDRKAIALGYTIAPLP